MANQQNPQHVVTGKVRLSYVHLFEKYANPNNRGAEPSYNTVILVPKSDIATKQRIDAAQEAAIQFGIAKKWGGSRPPVIASVVHDGDGVRPNGRPFSDECRGHWIFTASSKNQQPRVVDVNLNPIMDQSEVYSGVYARVAVDFYPYLNAGKAGIACGLVNVQKLEDGEPLGGRTSVDDDFGAANSPYQPAQPVQQPYQASQPLQYQQPMSQYQTPQPTQYQQPQFQQAFNQVPPMFQQPYQPGTAPAASQYQTPAAPAAPAQQIDPLTGRPIVGNVMGI